MIMDTKLKLGEFVRESGEWKRTLTLLLQENSFLKLHLADIVNRKEVSADFLETVELYQNRFIQKDEIINLLRQEVSELNFLLKQNVYDDETMPNEAAQKLKHLRRQIIFLETEFNKLKFHFSKYLSELH
jgi:hypothetical protein